jgi:hypothetical protein
MQPLEKKKKKHRIHPVISLPLQIIIGVVFFSFLYASHSQIKILHLNITKIGNQTKEEYNQDH